MEEPWKYWGINEEDWEFGWRRTIEDAVEAASVRLDLPGDRITTDPRRENEFDIRIKARKRSGNAVHDYIVNR